MPDGEARGTHFSPMSLPSDNRKLLSVALNIMADCRSSSGVRAAYCRQLNSMIETGRQDGSRSLINLLYRVIDRLASHLYSPTELRFAVDFENHYEEDVLKRAAMAARILTRDFERSNTDMMFGQGVFECLKYGACFLKQWAQEEGQDRHPVYYNKLVMPWQFGVYKEDENDLSRQYAMCETVMLTMPEVWRRISHLPDAAKLYARIEQHAQKGNGSDEANSFFHQVLSTSTLNTGNTGLTRPVPGGIVMLNNDPNYAILGPEVTVPLVKFHEMWVQDQGGRTTIQIVEPDILIAPQYKRANLLIGGEPHSDIHPYTLIQANVESGYMYGRSEIIDLIEPQGLLSVWADDAKRLQGLQIDKIIAFAGFDGVTVENYDQMRQAGFFGMPPGATANDMTPPMPQNMQQMLQFLIQIVEKLSGFDNILSGSGEPGVRAGVHADTLAKMASPHLRDRSLLIERQCASAADTRLSIMEAKDPRHYWTDAKNKEGTRFVLADLEDDRRVAVDSHSSSPIFADNHQNLIGFAAKLGWIDGESGIELLDFPNKDILIQRFLKKQAEQAALVKQHPELLAQILGGKKGHH